MYTRVHTLYIYILIYFLCDANRDDATMLFIVASFIVRTSTRTSEQAGFFDPGLMMRVRNPESGGPESGRPPDSEVLA